MQTKSRQVTLTKSNLGRSFVVRLAYLRQHRLVEQLRGPALLAIESILVSKRRIVRYMYTIVSMPFSEITLLKPRMTFNLVRSGNDGGILDQTLHLRLVKVRDADRPRLAGLQKLFHCFVRLLSCQRAWIHGSRDENATYVDDVDILQDRLPILLREEFLASFPGHGPVNQEQINVVHFQIVQGLLQSRCYVVWMVLVVP